MPKPPPPPRSSQPHGVQRHGAQPRSAQPRSAQPRGAQPPSHRVPDTGPPHSVHGLPPGHVPLERALSKLGLATRTEARALILAGRVSVDGAPIRDPQYAVVPERAALQIDAQAVQARPLILLALHKPRGTLVTLRDPQGRPTIYDLLQGVPEPVLAVGRLDQATSGLLLLTNDTRLAACLLDPKTGLARRYLVEVEGRVSPETVAQLLAGVDDRGEHLQATEVELRKASGRESQLLLSLCEGKNREVRRLLGTVGHPVRRLKRLAYGPIELGELQPGQWRAEDRVKLWQTLRPE